MRIKHESLPVKSKEIDDIPEFLLKFDVDEDTYKIHVTSLEFPSDSGNDYQFVHEDDTEQYNQSLWQNMKTFQVLTINIEKHYEQETERSKCLPVQQ